jgi:hypothetical protein
MATAKKETATPVATEVVSDKALSVLPPTGALMATRDDADLPDYLQEAKPEGVDHFTADDIELPRLGLAQKMSPEIDPENKSKFIEGLQYGDFFNTVTKENYGPGPLEIVVLRSDPPKHIEFAPMKTGGGVIDMDVPPDDPRTKFTRGEDGKPVAPIATKFYNYVALLLPNGTTVKSPVMIGVSLKSTSIKTAKVLNMLISNRMGMPIYAGKYEIGQASQTNKKGVYKVYTVRNSTINGAFNPPGKPGWVSKEVFDYAKQLFDQLKGRVITIDMETATHGDDEGDASFDTEKMERGATPSDM